MHEHDQCDQEQQSVNARVHSLMIERINRRWQETLDWFEAHEIKPDQWKACFIDPATGLYEPVLARQDEAGNLVVWCPSLEEEPAPGSERENDEQEYQ